MSADKQLQCTLQASEYQKEWFSRLRREVFTEGKPYAIVQADMPFELFEVMGMPTISNQWWAAIIAAKQLAPAYLEAMNAAGYHEGLCRYCSVAMASTIFPEAAPAPWGGLPKPAIIAARLTCDCVQKVFETWADYWQTEFFPLDNPAATYLPPRWWDLSRHHWEQLCGSDRLDYTVGRMRELIARLEQITGRTFDFDHLRKSMEAVNAQEEYFEEARKVICSAPKTPVRMQEQITNVMAAQWLRGSEWAVNHARAFRDEVKARADAGIAANQGERLRLMWIGAGLWHDTDFYTAFEEDLGGVFVWSMYLAFGPDGYIRYGLDDPLRALASRTLNMNEQLHNPPWMNEWMIEQAKAHRIDAVLMLKPLSCKPAITGHLFTERGLMSAGIPVHTVEADMVDSSRWDGAKVREDVRRFLSTVTPRKG